MLKIKEICIKNISNNCNLSERTINSTSTTATLSLLLPDSNYIIWIVAENQAGLGETSEELHVKTKKEGLFYGNKLFINDCLRKSSRKSPKFKGRSFKF